MCAHSRAAVRSRSTSALICPCLTAGAPQKIKEEPTAVVLSKVNSRSVACAAQLVFKGAGHQAYFFTFAMLPFTTAYFMYHLTAGYVNVADVRSSDVAPQAQQVSLQKEEGDARPQTETERERERETGRFLALKPLNHKPLSLSPRTLKPLKA